MHRRLRSASTRAPIEGRVRCAATSSPCRSKPSSMGVGFGVVDRKLDQLVVKCRSSEVICNHPSSVGIALVTL